MTVLRSVRVAAIQATPEILDAEGSVAKAARLLGDAADAGAELAVFPECFISRVPVQHLGQGVGLVRRLRRAVGADVAELGRRAGAAGGRARGCLPRRAGSTP